MQAWTEFLSHLENELGIETVEKWLRNLKIQRFDACNLYLEAQNSFQVLWFEEHIRARALKLVNANNKQIKIHLTPNQTSSSPASKGAKQKKDYKLPVTPFQFNFDDLDPTSLLAHFVVSEENQIVAKVIEELVQHPQSNTYNPFYLHGTSGAGKTHLLMSLAHSLRKKGLKVIYARAETFTDHVVSAIRASEMSRFREVYRNVDILIIDDVHIFSRKNATQEEFFHTFNTLHLIGKQIILSANCPPQELQHIEPRLISRFEWGLVLPLIPLAENQMTNLLEIKAKALNFQLTNVLTQFLLQTFTSTPKALIKALGALVLRLHLDSKNPLSALTIPAAKILLADLITDEKKSVITPNRIIQEVAEYFGLRIEDILGKSQTRECVQPRQIAMHLCRSKLKMPFMKIGELFSRDHSTIISGVKQIQKLLDQDDREKINAWYAIYKKLQT